MIWGFPTALYFAAMAIPVIAIFLYRRRSRVIDVPSSQIWAELGRPVQVRSFKSLLRRLISLALQLLLMAMLIAALADPMPKGLAVQRTIIVMDASFTMQTKEGTQTRMDQAKRQARAILDTIETGGEVAILQAANYPLLAQPITRDLELARRKIEAMTCLDVETDLQAAVELAGSLAGSDAPTKLIVISDFASASPQAVRGALRRRADLSLLAVGKDQPDAAIIGLRSEVEGGKLLLEVTIGSKGLAGRRVPVQLSQAGLPIDTQEVVLDDTPRKVAFTTQLADGLVYEVVLQSGDALAVDDRAWGAAGLALHTKVCLVSNGNVFLESALQAGGLAGVRIVSPADYRGPAADEVVIFDGPASPMNDTGQAAGYLFIGADDPFGWAKASGHVAASKTTHWASGHPCLTDIDPTAMSVTRALQMDWPGHADVQELVASGDTTLIAELSGLEPAQQDRRMPRCVYWLFDLRDSDLPRRLGFPLLLWNTIDFLGGNLSSSEDSVHLTGRPLVFARSASASVPLMTGPGGNPVEVRPAGQQAVVSDTFRAGIYRRADGGTPPAYTVNLLTGRALLPLPTDRPATDDFAGRQFVRRGGQWLSRYLRISWEALIMAGILLALLDWLLFTRGVVRVE
jgi:Ca-activated chloride channel family protein